MSVKEMITKRFLLAWKQLSHEIGDEDCTESRIVIAKGKENGRRYQVCLQIIIEDDAFGIEDFLSEGYGEIDINKETKRLKRKKSKEQK